MNGKAWGVACVVGGLAMAAGGWKLAKSQEPPPGSTGFSGVGRSTLVVMAGNGLMMLGLVLAVIIGSFFFIGG